MKHINDSYVNALLRVFYKNYMDTCPEDSGMSFEEFRDLADIDNVKLDYLTHNILKRPGKGGNKDLAKSMKYKPVYQKKFLATVTALLKLQKGD